MSTSSPEPADFVRLTTLSTGGGCACKLPLASLDELFAQMGATLPQASENLLIGALEGDDAAVFRLDDDRAAILTTDFFTPIVDDARDWGRIAAANAISDVYAMGGQPVLAVNLAAWPAQTLSMELLGDVLSGGASIASEAGCFVAGGHTIDDPVPKFGMAVVGFAHPDRLFRIDRLVPGDTLVLTKALGTGVLSTALKNAGAEARWIDGAVASMTRLNADAADQARLAGVRAATDVTGFGLLGHLHRMARASGVAAALQATSVPLLDGVLEAIDAGFVPRGTRANTNYLQKSVSVDREVPEQVAVALHDAQTSGGLLLGVPTGSIATAVVNALISLGHPAAVIGRVEPGTPGNITVTL